MERHREVANGCAGTDEPTSVTDPLEMSNGTAPTEHRAGLNTHTSQGALFHITSRQNRSTIHFLGRVTEAGTVLHSDFLSSDPGLYAVGTVHRLPSSAVPLLFREAHVQGGFRPLHRQWW